MEKILIQNDTNLVIEEVERHLPAIGKLKNVTVFRHSYNFLMTTYELLSPCVHMVLEFEHMEMQIEGLNCGYVDNGPNTSIKLMERLGLSKQQIEPLFHGNSALSFSVDSGFISHLNTYQLFYGEEELPLENDRIENHILLTDNVSVLLDEKLVRFYNPQRTNWIGFLNLLGYMKNIQMEYYIGNSSPLDGRIYLGTGAFGSFRQGMDNVDLDGVQHCNLYLRGDNFNISCLIDRDYEKEVIEFVYLALTGKKLLLDKKIARRRWINKVFHHGRDVEIYKHIVITDR